MWIVAVSALKNLPNRTASARHSIGIWFWSASSCRFFTCAGGSEPERSSSGKQREKAVAAGELTEKHAK
jgi:hypothetical protein